MTRITNARLLAPALLLLVALAVAGCSGGDDDDAGASAALSSDDGGDDDSGDDGDFFDGDDAMAEDVDASDAGDSEGTSEADAGDVQLAGTSAGDTTGPDPATIGRSIIYTANLEVRVEDVSLAASQAKTAIAGIGGFVFGEDTQVGEVERTVLEFKVFPADFQTALARLEGLGELIQQQISADDVTERIVDLSSRVATAEISVERLRSLLEEQTDLSEIAAVEAQLLQRETDLELLRGQLRTVQDQVDLATIFLVLRAPEPPRIEAAGEIEVSYALGLEDGRRCPGGDLSIDEGERLTVCVEISNVGNVAFGDIEVANRGLGLRARDFEFIGADAEVVLAPGERLVAWAEADAPGDGGSFVEVSAVAVDDDGEPLRTATSFETVATSEVRFIEDTSLPGFGDAVRGSFGALKTLGGVALVVLGAALVWIWIVPLVWAAGRLVRRRQRAARPAPPSAESAA